MGRRQTLPRNDPRRDQEGVVSARSPAHGRADHLQPIPHKVLASESHKHDFAPREVRLRSPARALMASHATDVATRPVRWHEPLVR
jgi:hypothetical protein